MVSSSQKKDLLETYGRPLHARAVLARAAIGLVVVVTGALIGASDASGDAPAAEVRAERVASGR